TRGTGSRAPPGVHRAISCRNESHAGTLCWAGGTYCLRPGHAFPIIGGVAGISPAHLADRRRPASPGDIAMTRLRGEPYMRKPVTLIAECDETSRRGLRELLLRHGSEVIESGDMTSIYHVLRHKSSPDLLLVSSSLDVEDDGVKLIQQIRQWDKQIPLILLTAHSSEDA